MAPALGLGAALGTVLAACFLLAAHRSINDWLLPLLTRLAHPEGNFLTRAALWPLAKAAEGVLSVVNFVDHHVSVAAAHGMAPLARFLGGYAAWITTLAYNAGNFAATTASGFERLVAHTIPHEIALGTRPLWHRIRADRRYLLGLLLPELALGKWLFGQLHHHVLPRLKYLYHQTAVVLPRAIAREGLRIKDLERTLTHPSRAWLKRIARAMWGVALFGLLVRFLARRFPWLFCRKVSSVGRRLCGLDQDLLNALLMETTLIAGTISVVEFAKDLQAIEGVAVDFMRQSIKEL